MQTAQKLFTELAISGEIDQTHWTRFCRVNNVSSGVFSVAFAKATRGTAKKMNEAMFAAALDTLAAKDICVHTLQVPKTAPSSRAPLKGPVRFFYDKRTYTGTHKSGNSETSVVHDLRELCDRSLCDTRGRKIAAAPAPGFATHDDIKSRKNSGHLSLPTTPRPSTAPTPKADRSSSLPRKAEEEEHTQPPPIPTKFEEAGEKENINEVTPKRVDLFSNIPTFAFTPVWPSANKQIN